MTESEKEIIKEVQRVFPEASEGMIRKTIYETKLQVAGKLDECKLHYDSEKSDHTTPNVLKLISLQEAKDKILNNE
jgi:hypothetical protein